MEKLKNIYKKVRRFLLLNDWIWSVLGAFFLYQLINIGPATIFDVAVAYFQINWLQPLVSTAGVMAGLFAIMRLGMYFNLRRKHDYTWGKRDKTSGEFKLEAFDDFKKLTPWQKHLSVTFWLVFLFATALIVYLSHIPTAAPL